MSRAEAAPLAGALPPDALEYRADRGRTAALIAAAGLATFFVYVAATRTIFLFDLTYVTPIFAVLVVLNLLLAALPGWARWPAAVYAWEAFHVVTVSVIIHLLGGLVMSILLIVYAFPLILTEMLGSGRSVFVTANLSATCYGVMAWVEREPLRDVGIDTEQQIAFVALAFVVLNFLALYTNRYGYQLRNLARHLQHKVAERTAELTAVNAELGAKARALEAKQEEFRTFVYTVTHDLKAPLSAILLTADLLLERTGGALAPDEREDLERIVRLAGGAEDMIRDLLELFRITSLPEAPTWIDLRALVSDTLQTLGPQIAAKRARVEIGALPQVFADPQKLGRVVGNLLSNAVKYVPTGRGEIVVSGATENGGVVLAVRDNGIGIPEAYHRVIFELFGRVPRREQEVDGKEVGGTGVGLAIVRRIVEAHRGTVTVSSAPGAGSCFEVRLPTDDGGARG